MGTDKYFFLLFSHQLTSEQTMEATNQLGVKQVVPLPPALQKQWSNVPPDTPGIQSFAQPILEWLADQARPGDYVLVQGDFGMVYEAVSYCKERGLTPLYATTERISIEYKQPNGGIRLERHFHHRRFRLY